MFDGMQSIFKVTAGYNSAYHHRMGWVVGGHLFSLKTLLYFILYLLTVPSTGVNHFYHKLKREIHSHDRNSRF